MTELPIIGKRHLVLVRPWLALLVVRSALASLGRLPWLRRLTKTLLLSRRKLISRGIKRLSLAAKGWSITKWRLTAKVLLTTKPWLLSTPEAIAIAIRRWSTKVLTTRVLLIAKPWLLVSILLLLLVAKPWLLVTVLLLLVTVTIRLLLVAILLLVSIRLLLSTIR